MNITIYRKNLKEYEKEGEKKARETYDEDVIEDFDPVLLNGVFDVDEIIFEDGVLTIAGEMSIDRKEILYIDLDIDIDFDLAVEIVKHLTSKINEARRILGK